MNGRSPSAADSNAKTIFGMSDSPTFPRNLSVKCSSRAKRAPGRFCHDRRDSSSGDSTCSGSVNPTNNRRRMSEDAYSSESSESLSEPQQSEYPSAPAKSGKPASTMIQMMDVAGGANC